MQFTILREALLTPLSLVAGAVEKRSTLPILSNVLIQVADQRCTLTGTDTEVELIGRVSLEHAAIPGQITVPARKLLDICRALPDGAEIEFSHENQRLTIKSGRARFNLATLAAEDFPHIETQVPDQELCINNTQFQSLLKKTYFAMAVEDVRYFLNGALLDIHEGEIKLVATDGHRLALSPLLSVNTPLNMQAIIPRKTIHEMMRLFQKEDETLLLYLGTHYLKLTAGEATIVSKLIDGRYPDYRKVIPKPSEKFLIIDKDAFKQALICIAVVTNEKQRGVRIQIRPQVLKIQARNTEQEDAEQELAVFEQTGDNLDIGFNVNYLLDALNAIDDSHVKMTFSDSNNGIILENPEGKSGRYIVMPMRL